MTRILVTCLLLVVLFTWPCEAKPLFGIKGGLSWANAWIKHKNTYSSYDAKTGIIAGISFTPQMRDSSSLYSRLDILYVQKGWTRSGSSSYVTYDYHGTEGTRPGRNESSLDGDGKYQHTYYIDDLVFAPFAVYYFHKGRTIRAFLQLGAEFGINVRHTVKTSGNGSHGSYVLHDWEPFNPGLNIGAGLTIPNSNGEMVIDCRYNLGLMNLTRNRDAGEDYTHTQGLQILLGYNFKKPIIRK